MYPLLIEFGPLSIYSYGVLLAAAYLTGLWFASIRAKNSGLDGNRVTDLGIYIIISALIGAKLLLIVVEFDHFVANPASFWTVLRSGGVLDGGLLLAIVVAFLYMRRHRLPFWTTCDAFAPGIALGQSIGRIGCLMALVWRVIVNKKPERKFADTVTVVFLLFVVVSGFILEAQRLAVLPPDPLYWMSFLGYALSFVLTGNELSGMSYSALWYIHVFGSCAFIAYVPARRLVHSCATPIGRLMNSQTKLIAKKREAYIVGLMGGHVND